MHPGFDDDITTHHLGVPNADGGRHLWLWTHPASAQEAEQALRTGAEGMAIEVHNRWPSRYAALKQITVDQKQEAANVACEMI